MMLVHQSAVMAAVILKTILTYLLTYLLNPEIITDPENLIT